MVALDEVAPQRTVDSLEIETADLAREISLGASHSLLPVDQLPVPFAATVLPEQEPTFHDIVLVVFGRDGEPGSIWSSAVAELSGDRCQLVRPSDERVPHLGVALAAPRHAHAWVARVESGEVRQLQRYSVGVAEPRSRLGRELARWRTVGDTGLRSLGFPRAAVNRLP